MTDTEAEAVIKEFNDGYPQEKVLVTELRQLGLTTVQIAGVVTLVDEVCHYCWNTIGNCYCMRDD